MSEHETETDNTYNPHPSEYLNDLEEWGRNQYNPGYYIGNGRLPPIYRVFQNRLGRKTKGIIAMIGGTIAFAHVISSIFQIDFHDAENTFMMLPGNIFGVIFGLILFWTGIKQIRRKGPM